MKKKRPAHEYVGHTCRPPAHHTCDSRSRLKVAAVISHWEVTSLITRRRLDTSWTKDHYKNPEQHWGSIKSSWLLGSAMGRRASSSPRWGTPPSLTGLPGLGSVSHSVSPLCVSPAAEICQVERRLQAVLCKWWKSHFPKDVINMEKHWPQRDYKKNIN